MCLKTDTILIATHLSSVSLCHNNMPIYGENLSLNISVKYHQLIGPYSDFER